MHGLCFVCASNCTHSFVNCKECGLTFHSECLRNEQLLEKYNSRFELPCKIVKSTAEAADYQLEQCQVCKHLEVLSKWKDKVFGKVLVKTLEVWYDNCKHEKNGASEGDKRRLLIENCDIKDVLSSKEIKEEFDRGASRSSKIVTSAGTEDFPVTEIGELRRMINENRISLREFFLRLWCWITVIRSLGKKRKASLVYAHLCHEELVSYVKTHLPAYLSCPTHYTSMNEDYIGWKEESEGESVNKDRFPLCEPAHQFAWLKRQKKLVFILKVHEEIDGFKIEYAEVYQDAAESRERIPIEKFQKPTPDQILHAKPRKRRKINSDLVADHQYVEEYKEFLKKLRIHESVEIDEQYLFDPEKHQRKSKSVHTQTYSSGDSDNVLDSPVLSNGLEEGAFEDIQKLTKFQLEKVKRENEKPHKPKCSICILEYKKINEKRIHNSKEIKLAQDAVYFSTDFQMFSCEHCFDFINCIFDEQFVIENTKEGAMQFKDGASIAKTFVPITELQKIYNP